MTTTSQLHLSPCPPITKPSWHRSRLVWSSAKKSTHPISHSSQANEASYMATNSAVRILIWHPCIEYPLFTQTDPRHKWENNCALIRSERDGFSSRLAAYLPARNVIARPNHCSNVVQHLDRILGITACLYACGCSQQRE
jgi:hypothetical protein